MQKADQGTSGVGDGSERFDVDKETLNDLGHNFDLVLNAVGEQLGVCFLTLIKFENITMLTHLNSYPTLTVGHNSYPGDIEGRIS